MAISFSRPDPSSPAAVGSASFPVARRGFDQGEVRDFLRMVAAELARLQERERFLESEMRAMQTRGMSAPGRLDEETVTTLLGEEAARVLSTARDASSQIRERAEESATRLVKDAADDAVRIREAAMAEAARMHEDAIRDSEQEIEMAKQQGRDMVNEARAYREKVLSELSRRRDAARHQIEELLHGRDRLTNAFERARLASEDVLKGLTEAHDEPEFIVDLAPVTGPVPIVNPAHPSVGGVYDRTAETEAPAVQQPVQSGPSAIFNIEEQVVETIAADVEQPVEIVEVVADPVVDVADARVDASIEEEMIAIVEEIAQAMDHPVVSAPAEEKDVAPEPVVEDEPAQTNVVSLFGRGRRAPDMPEVAEEPVAEDPKKDSPAPVIQPPVLEKTDRRKVEGVDDIFAKLRAGSTDQVAKAASAPAADKSVADKPAAAAAPKADKKADKTSKKKPHAGIVPSDPARFAERDGAIADTVVAMTRKLKRALADEQNDVLQHLRLKKSSLEIEAFLGTVDEHAARYATAIVEETMAAAGAGAKSVKTAGGNARRVTQKAVDAHVVATIAHGLVAEFREETRIAIGEAEGDREILSGLMRDVYRKWKVELIESHTDAIACSAFSKGGFLSLEPGSPMSWMIDPAHSCCSECEDNSLAGVVAKGDEFPTGHEHPPAHPGCRCLVVPVQG